jgi:hypothetical protein
MDLSWPTAILCTCSCRPPWLLLPAALLISCHHPTLVIPSLSRDLSLMGALLKIGGVSHHEPLRREILLVSR